MTKIDLVIADRDPRYVKSLEKYIMTNYPLDLSIHSFYSFEDFAAFCTGIGKDTKRKPDIMLVGSDFIQAAELTEKPETTGKDCMVIMLSEDKLSSNKSSGKKASGHIPSGHTPSGHTPSIFKYQHAGSIISALLGKYASIGGSRADIKGMGDTMVVTFISANGGGGSSSLSATCSILASQRGIRSFYLNLEDIPSTKSYFNGSAEWDFSNVIYYIKERAENLNIKLEGSSCTDPESGVRYFIPSGNIRDMEELGSEDMEVLIDSFRGNSSHDVVFIDIPGRLDKRNSAIVMNSDVIVQLHLPGGEAAQKSRELSRVIEDLGKSGPSLFSGRIVKVLNRCKVGEEISFEDGADFNCIVHEQVKGKVKAGYGEMNLLLDRILEKQGAIK